MVKYKGIEWPVTFSSELKARVEKASLTLGLHVAIASEIYQLGNEFKQGLLDSFESHQEPYPLMCSILDTHEASGYARVGYEILFFRNPQEIYIDVKEFLQYHLRNYEGMLDAKPQNMVAPWLDITPLMNRFLLGTPITKEELNAAWEDQLTSIEADGSIRSAQIVQRKSSLLSNNGPQSLLEDLLRESVEIEEKSIEDDKNADLPKELEPLNFFNPTIHAIRGIRAGIQRYEELYRYFAYDLLN